MIPRVELLAETDWEILPASPGSITYENAPWTLNHS